MKKKNFHRLAAVWLSAALITISIPMERAKAADIPPETPRVSVHDPSILKADGTYYLFGTHLADAKSTDLIQWTQMNPDWNAREDKDSWKNDSVYGEILSNLAESFAWAGYDDGDVKNGGLGVWAPDAIFNPDYVWEDSTKGAYMLYYSASSTWRRSCIGYAVSKTPEGPYQHIDTIIYSGFTENGAVDNGLNGGVSTRNTKWDNDYLNLKELIDNGTILGVSDKWFDRDGGWNHNYGPNAIDPTVFWSKDGNLYMVYGSWSGGLFIHQLDKATGAVKYPGEDSIEPISGNFTDRYFGTHIAGGNHQSGEGCYILYDAETDYYYMYETYGGLLSDGGYNMRLFRSKNVYGPYTDAAGNNAKDSGSNNDNYGIKLIGNYAFQGQPGYRAAGHNSALIDDDGSRYLFHHQRFNVPEQQHEGHQVRVRRQYMNEDQWPVPAVYEYRGEEIGHYSNDEIIGSYEIINHGTATNGDMIYSQSLDLCADGTVIGAMSGTWTKSTGTSKSYDYITLNLNGHIYKGFLYKQFNEETNSQKVMTFSAIGEDNTCLWGSQTTESKSLDEALIYNYDFETPASGNSLAPTKNSHKKNSASLIGTSAIVKDASRGSVLQIQNEEKAQAASYLRLPADTLSTVTKEGYTISMWVNIGTDTMRQSALFEANSGNNSNYTPMTRMSANLLCRIDANSYADSVPSDFSQNQWHHLAYSVSPQGLKTYLDGRLKSSISKDLNNCFDTSLDESIQKASNVCVGSGLVYGNEDVRNVKLDDVAVYSAALSPRQIAQIYSTDTTTKKPVQKSEQKITVKSTINKTYGDKAFSLKATLTQGNGSLSYSSSSPSVAAINRNTGKVTIKNTGLAKITITASETASYKAKTATVTIKIAPKGISLSSVKSNAAKKASLKWNTASRASGYRIQYAANAKFKSARTVLVSKAKTKTNTITKLKRKKTYYFRIQPYKKSGNTFIWGKYSKAKKVKIK